MTSLFSKHESLKTGIVSDSKLFDICSIRLTGCWIKKHMSIEMPKDMKLSDKWDNGQPVPWARDSYDKWNV